MKYAFEQHNFPSLDRDTKRKISISQIYQSNTSELSNIFYLNYEAIANEVIKIMLNTVQLFMIILFDSPLRILFSSFS